MKKLILLFLATPVLADVPSPPIDQQALIQAMLPQSFVPPPKWQVKSDLSLSYNPIIVQDLRSNEAFGGINHEFLRFLQDGKERLGLGADAYWGVNHGEPAYALDLGLPAGTAASAVYGAVSALQKEDILPTVPAWLSWLGNAISLHAFFGLRPLTGRSKFTAVGTYGIAAVLKSP